MRSKTDAIYVFDIDGVIVDPRNSTVDQGVVNAIRHLLMNNTYLAVNTGRSFDWVESHLLKQLKECFNDEILRRFVVMCEKGGEAIIWQAGKPVLRPSKFALPSDAYAITKSVFNQNKAQFQTMFWDATKRTMATVEKKPAADLAVFHTEQKRLVDMLSTRLSDHKVKIDQTVSATDVESLEAGKHAGAQLIYEWLDEVGYSKKRSFISIGDSVSDYEMARYFAEQDAESTFVYVGKPSNNIVHHEQVTFVSPMQRYCLGTLEFLSNRVPGAEISQSL